jgi:hypothetical protein
VCQCGCACWPCPEAALNILVSALLTRSRLRHHAHAITITIDVNVETKNKEIQETSSSINFILRKYCAVVTSVEWISSRSAGKMCSQPLLVVLCGHPVSEARYSVSSNAVSTAYTLSCIALAYLLDKLTPTSCTFFNVGRRWSEETID